MTHSDGGGATDRANRRELPGGGFAAIEITRVTGILKSTIYLGALVVERRVRPDRPRTRAPLVVARATARTPNAVLGELWPIMHDNAALAAAILRCQRMNRQGAALSDAQRA